MIGSVTAFAILLGLASSSAWLAVLAVATGDGLVITFTSGGQGASWPVVACCHWWPWCSLPALSTEGGIGRVLVLVVVEHVRSTVGECENQIVLCHLGRAT